MRKHAMLAVNGSPAVHSPWSWLLLSFLLLSAIAASVPLWGTKLLISADPLTPSVDEAVVLQGSIQGENARLRGAVQLVKQGRAGRMLVSIPKESYWGQAIAPLALGYIEQTYGSEIADRTDFCQTGMDVNSTELEAEQLTGCIEHNGAHLAAVVTSDYHTRRAGIIWRKVLRRKSRPLSIVVYGVSDPEFQTHGWWKDRLSAKTWFMEMTKLMWMLAFEQT